MNRLYHYYDFGGGLDFTVKDLKVALRALGPVFSKHALGNDTGYHCRTKRFGNGNDRSYYLFVYMSDYTKDPHMEPGQTLQDWEWVINLSNKESRYLSHIPSFKDRMRHRNPHTVDVVNVDDMISTARQTTGEPFDPDRSHLTFEIPPAKDYWETERTKKLFCPRDESVPECLQRRIELLRGALRDDKVADICVGGEETISVLSGKAKRKLEHSILMLAMAYQVALNKQGEGFGWFEVCEETIQQFNEISIDTYKSPRHIMEWNAKFRVAEKIDWSHQKRKDHGPMLFRVFQEATRMFTQFCRDNMETVSARALRSHIEETVLPVCLENLNQDLEKAGEEKVSMAKLRDTVDLKKLDETTCWRWLKWAGWGWKPRLSNYQTDNHERIDNKTYRNKKYLPMYTDAELRCYRWVQVPEEDAIQQENNDRNPLPRFSQDSKHWYCYEEDGKKMREYHVDVCESMSKAFVDADQYAKYGGNLSVRKSANERPLIILGQDEMITYQYLFSSKCWVSPNENCTVSLWFSPKYHCEIAGEAIESSWGMSKKHTRRQKLADKKDFGNFIKIVKESLTMIGPTQQRRLCRRQRKYMIAYLELAKKEGGTDVNFQELEDSVKTMFKTNNSPRRRRHKKRSRSPPKSRNPEAELNHISWNEAAEKAQKIEGSKKQRTKNTTAIGTPIQVTPSDHPVDVTKFMDEVHSHRDIGEMDKSFINEEYEQALKEMELRSTVRRIR